MAHLNDHPRQLAPRPIGKTRTAVCLNRLLRKVKGVPDRGSYKSVMGNLAKTLSCQAPMVANWRHLGAFHYGAIDLKPVSMRVFDAWKLICRCLCGSRLQRMCWKEFVDHQLRELAAMRRSGCPSLSQQLPWFLLLRKPPREDGLERFLAVRSARA